jgi:hypothetical protein
MKNILLLAWATCLLAHASEPALTKSMKAEYSVYSGELGNAQAPTKTERKLSIEVTGQAAKDIFDSLYPDAKGVACSDEKGQRLRSKGNVWCIYQPSDGYRCFLGYNLRTGGSIPGGSC